MSSSSPQPVPLLTLPNVMTLARIALVVPIALLLLPEEAWTRWIAFALMVAASVTDWADGYLARARGQVSPLGRLLDPIADKLLVAAILVVLVATRDVSGWEVIPVLAILSREIFISGLREYMMEHGFTVHVTKLAKWKTTLQLVAVAVIILVPVFGPAAGWVAGALLWIAAAITVYTGWGYLSGSLKHMAGPTEEV